MDFEDAQRLGHALRRRGPVAGQQRQVGDAQPAQLAEHRRRLGAHLVARPDRPQHPAAAATSNAVCPSASSRSSRASASGGTTTPCSSSSRRLPTTTAPAAVRAVTPPPGWARKSSTASGVRPRRAASCQDDPGQRMFAALLRRRGDGQQFVGWYALKRYDFSDFQAALGQRAGLVEGEGVDARPAVPGPSRP